MNNDKLQVILTEQNVAKENMNQLLEAFGAPFAEAGKVLADYRLIKVTEEDQFDLMAEARSKRLTLKSIRVGVENKRKELKEDSLRTGRAIDSVAKFVKEIIEPAEKYLEEQEKFAEIKAAARAAEVKTERTKALMQYTDDISVYNLDTMTAEQFQALLTSLKDARDAQIAQDQRIKAEATAKAEAEEKERKRLKAENDKLQAKAKAEEAEKKRIRDIISKITIPCNFNTVEEVNAAGKSLDEYIDSLAETDASNDEIIHAAINAKDNITNRRQRLIAEAKAKQDRLRAVALQKEKDDAAALAKAKQAEAEEKERQALLAPDKEKLLALAATLENTQLPALSSKDAQAVLNKTEELLGKISSYIRGNVKGL